MLVPSLPGPQNSLVELSLTQTSGLPPPTDSYSPWPRPKEHYFLQAPVVILMLGSETTASGTSPFGLPWATSKKGLAFPTHRPQPPGSLAFSVVPTPSLPFTLRMIFSPVAPCLTAALTQLLISASSGSCQITPPSC